MFYFTKNIKRFYCWFPKSICLANEELNNFEIICKVESDIIETRVNDAKVDNFGGIVFGTYNENPNKKIENLMQMFIGYPLQAN